MKFTGYKYQVQQALQSQGWEITAIDRSEAWWDDEHWKIESVNFPKRTLLLCFVVDPQFESPRKQGQGIVAIKACRQMPINWNDDNNCVASIYMSKRRFEDKLQEFLSDLEASEGLH